MKKKFCLLALIGIVFFIFSCAGNYGLSRQKAITGYWKSENNIYLSIETTDKYGVAALIKFSPDYAVSEDFKSGTPLMVNIKALADGSYSGIFLVKGGKSMKIRMVFTNPIVLSIVSWDKRAKGRMMNWTRVRNKEEIDFLERQ